MKFIISQRERRAMILFFMDLGQKGIEQQGVQKESISFDVMMDTILKYKLFSTSVGGMKN